MRAVGEKCYQKWVWWVLLVLVGYPLNTSSKTVHWLGDQIITTSNFIQTNITAWELILQFHSNGPIYSNVDGHFNLKFSVNYGFNQTIYGVTTRCLGINEPMQSVIGTIQDNIILGNDPLSIGDDTPFSKYFEVSGQKFVDSYNSSTNSTSIFELIITSKISKINWMRVAVNTSNCATPQTIGSWSDPSRWKENKVPAASDTVIIPSNAGVIQLSSDVNIAALDMYGGVLLAYTSTCPFGWTLDDRNSSTQKCYKAFDIALPYDEAEQFCNQAIGMGSSDRQLVHIGDRNENALVASICRGDNGTNIDVTGCWIGFRDMDGSGNFNWIEPLAIGSLSGQSLYLDWRRYEPDNMTIINDVASLPGKRCVYFNHWKNIPLWSEQGNWVNDDCGSNRSFVCQAFGDTIRYTLKVANSSTITGGVIVGGVLETGSMSTNITSFSGLRSASINVKSSTAYLQTIHLLDGAVLSIQSHINIYGNALIGQKGASSSLRALIISSNDSSSLAQPMLVVSSTGSITAACSHLSSCASVASIDIDARANISGNITVAKDVSMSFSQVKLPTPPPSSPEPKASSLLSLGWRFLLVYS